MRKNLVSEIDDKHSEKANLWNSVIKRGGGIFDESFELTPEIMEQIEKDSEERQKRIEKCSARGHPNSKSQGMEYFRERITVFMYCNDCGEYYNRSPTTKEEEIFVRNMNILVY